MALRRPAKGFNVTGGPALNTGVVGGPVGRVTGGSEDQREDRVEERGAAHL